VAFLIKKWIHGLTSTSSTEGKLSSSVQDPNPVERGIR